MTLGLRLVSSLRTIPALFLAVSVVHGPAWAQSERLQKPIVETPGRTRNERGLPPPALPGTLTGKDRVAPADKSLGDMPPTEALFDAINRGDIASARDALNRGADFTARNVLGLTPLDQSIDLGRNDITFLLLSLRGAAPEPAPADSVAAKGARPSAVAEAGKKPAPAAHPVAQPAPKVTVNTVTAKTVTATTVTGPAAPPMPRSGDAGTPNAQSGFLGFGG